jgi:hypothetical protein
MFHSCPPKENCSCSNPKQGNNWNWDFVDSAVCISLIDRDERMKSAAEEFHKVGLCTKILFYRPARPDAEFVKINKIQNAGVYGCYESHRTVAQMALKKNCETNLVFEDDVMFLKSLTPNYLNQISIDVRTKLPLTWDIYFLGHKPNNLWAGTQRLDKHLHKVKSFLAHAYIQSRKFMTTLDQTPFLSNHLDIDNWMSKTCEQFACSPMIAVQKRLNSDIRPGRILSSGYVHESFISFVEPIIHEPAVALIIITIVILILILLFYFLLFRNRSDK